MTSMSDRFKNLQQLFVPILVVVAIGLAFFSGSLWQQVENYKKGGTQTTATTTAAAPSPTVSLDTIKALWGKNLIKFGDANKKLLFVEVADPSCPYCHVAGGDDPQVGASMGTQFKYVSDGGAYQPPVAEMKKLVDSGQASFTYIFYPGHGNGEMGAKALYCAFDQGKFWEAHGLIMSEKGYEIQNGYDSTGATTKGPIVQNDKTKSALMADFLKGVVDPTQLKSCLDSGKYDSRLTDEQNLATTLGITGTPGFFVNSTPFAGAYSWTDMKTTVDAALK